ncbi:hypothetical protein BDR06DRAFT_716029 [Suillus hirtellus]|nr:hypothetical protein BDR06DRAFT_716029 [Suillus hirtellus]
MMRHGDTLWAVSCACLLSVRFSYVFCIVPLSSYLLRRIHGATCFTSFMVLYVWIRIFFRRTWKMIAVVMLKAQNSFVWYLVMQVTRSDATGAATLVATRR